MGCALCLNLEKGSSLSGKLIHCIRLAGEKRVLTQKDSWRGWGEEEINATAAIYKNCVLASEVQIGDNLGWLETRRDLASLTFSDLFQVTPFFLLSL